VRGRGGMREGACGGTAGSLSACERSPSGPGWATTGIGSHNSWRTRNSAQAWPRERGCARPDSQQTGDASVPIGAI
jgi:hypothetical protein